jgi:hypothetical protein
MAAQPVSFDPRSERGYKHEFHAEAYILKADLEQPIQERVRPQAKVKLADGVHYEYRQADAFHVDGILSYRSGYTQVAGHKSPKPGHGYATLSTSVIEGFNLLDVVTADRIVAQISTEHPVTGGVPEVSFLGTRFDNLRIGGRPVEIDSDLDIMGPKPDQNESYFEQASVLSRLSRQYGNISAANGLPEWAADRYPRDREGWHRHENNHDELHCSLVNNIDARGCFGHVINLPHFGKIFLAELTVRRDKACDDRSFDGYTFNLTMIRMELGCPVVAGGSAGSSTNNGSGSQTGSGPNN